MKLNQVHSIKATPEQNVFELECNITVNGEGYDTTYVSRPDDQFGLNPVIRQWLADNPDFPITPYAPPTAEEVRSTMPSLTARQFRLGLVSAGLTPAQVTATIEALPASRKGNRSD